MTLHPIHADILTGTYALLVQSLPDNLLVERALTKKHANTQYECPSIQGSQLFT